jgi:hypothetical protein
VNERSQSHGVNRGPDNTLGLDYAAEAERFRKFDTPLIDIHTHIHGSRASAIYQRVAQQFGVGTTYSMSRMEEFQEVKAQMGDAMKLISMPRFNSPGPLSDHGKGYSERIRMAYQMGARIAKFWSAPRLFDFVPGFTFHNHPLRLTSPERLEGIQTAIELRMSLMFHVADPDTWFASQYADQNRYGTKRQHHELFENILEKYPVTTIGAHMAGSPENLTYLSTLLSRYPHLYLDISATKWMVRELSKHPRHELTEFFQQWRERILFGSDIVTQEAHLTASTMKSGKELQASSAEGAYDLYASRYWALRTLLETNYEGPSPIVDPDLSMTDPARYGSDATPLLRGACLPVEVLEQVYFRNAARLALQNGW